MIRSICILAFLSGGIQALHSQALDDKTIPATSPANTPRWYDYFNESEISTGWEVIDEITDEPSNWHIEQGFLIENSNIGNVKELTGSHIIAGESNWENYFLKTEFIATDDDFIGVLFRYKDKDNYYCFLHSSQRRITCLGKRVSGVFTVLDERKNNDAYCSLSLALSALHDTLIVYLDNDKILEAYDGDLSSGKIGFLSCANAGMFIDYVEVYNELKIIPKNKEAVINRGPYIQSVLDDKATIMWGTNFPLNSGVEYGLSKRPEFTINKENKVTNHEIELSGLTEETYYYYRVRSGDLTSEWYSFKSAVNEKTDFKFIAYGDTQLNFLRHKDIIKQIEKHEFDLIVHVGDAVQYGARENWNIEFFDPLAGILNSKPVYVSIGNHQLDGKFFYDYFAFPEPEHENYYSISYGNSFFIFLDNRRAAYPDKLFYAEISKGSVQYEWLVSQLSSKEAQAAEWLFVVAHVPSFVISSQDYYPDCKKYLVPLFEKYGVDVSFSGHVHGYDRGKVNGVNYVVTGGGGGKLDLSNSKMIRKCENCKLVHNYCTVEISGKKLSFTAFDINGDVIDFLEIIK